MSTFTESSENDPRFHTTNIRKMLTDVIEHVRQDVSRISDPKAQALFETTAEVLIGLRKAYEDYDKQSEPAWKQAS